MQAMPAPGKAQAAAAAPDHQRLHSSVMADTFLFCARKQNARHG